MSGPKVPRVLRDALYRAHEREIAKSAPKQEPKPKPAPPAQQQKGKK